MQGAAGLEGPEGAVLGRVEFQMPAVFKKFYFCKGQNSIVICHYTLLILYFVSLKFC